MDVFATVPKDSVLAFRREPRSLDNLMRLRLVLRLHQEHPATLSEVAVSGVYHQPSTAACCLHKQPVGLQQDRDVFTKKGQCQEEQ